MASPQELARGLTNPSGVVEAAAAVRTLTGSGAQQCASAARCSALVDALLATLARPLTPAPVVIDCCEALAAMCSLTGPHWRDGEAVATALAEAGSRALTPHITPGGAATSAALRTLVASLRHRAMAQALLLDQPLLRAILTTAQGDPGGIGIGNTTSSGGRQQHLGAGPGEPVARILVELSAALEFGYGGGEDYEESGVSDLAKEAAKDSPALVRAAAWFLASSGDFKCAAGAQGILIFLLRANARACVRHQPTLLADLERRKEQLGARANDDDELKEAIRRCKRVAGKSSSSAPATSSSASAPPAAQLPAMRLAPVGGSMLDRLQAAAADCGLRVGGLHVVGATQPHGAGGSRQAITTGPSEPVASSSSAVAGRGGGSRPVAATSGASSGSGGAARCCAACGRDGGEDGSALKLCVGCKTVRYCSRDCQKRHWAEHKAHCCDNKT